MPLEGEYWALAPSRVFLLPSGKYYFIENALLLSPGNKDLQIFQVLSGFSPGAEIEKNLRHRIWALATPGLSLVDVFISLV